MQYEEIKVVIDEQLNVAILITILQIENGQVNVGLHECQLDALELLSNIFYSELKEQITWLSKLNFVDVLNSIRSELKLDVRFPVLLSNMLGLQTPELNRIRQDFFL